jgi:hypothetical protein
MKKTLRWIAVTPASFVAYAVANLIQSLFAAEWMPVDALEYLRSNPDLGPYQIRGSLYVIITGLASTVVAMHAAQLVAPPHNERRALFLMAGIWGILGVGSLALMYFHPQPAGVAVRRCLGMGAEVAGIIVALRVNRESWGATGVIGQNFSLV